jgi:hypothetical protein
MRIPQHPPWQVTFPFLWKTRDSKGASEVAACERVGAREFARIIAREVARL